MGLRVNKHISLGKNLRLNISKSGVGISGGVKGARVSYNPKTGVRTSVGLPGTGIYYTEQHKLKTQNNITHTEKHIEKCSDKHSENESQSTDIKQINKDLFSKMEKRLIKIYAAILVIAILLDAIAFNSDTFFWIIFMIDCLIFIIGMIAGLTAMNKANKKGEVLKF